MTHFGAIQKAMEWFEKQGITEDDQIRSFSGLSGYLSLTCEKDSYEYTVNLRTKNDETKIEVSVKCTEKL